MSTFNVLTIVVLIPLYDRAFVPAAWRLTGRENGISGLQRRHASARQRHRRWRQRRQACCGRHRMGDAPGWIPDDLDEGHLDGFFWMMAGLGCLNLMAFVSCARRYKSRKA
ncbi:hypothetical protein ZWY2020_001840 [Hordeum vulgare]|nr:hypothetical protein ZWY2020_001840 [Hordeum vulgare]